MAVQAPVYVMEMKRYTKFKTSRRLVDDDLNDTTLWYLREKEAEYPEFSSKNQVFLFPPGFE